MTHPAAVRTVRLAERSRSPHRLGRHVAHDPRSLAYAAPVLPRSAIRSVKWEGRIGVLDQNRYRDSSGSFLSLGSCVGNAVTYWLGTDNATRAGLTHVDGRALDEQWAVDVGYHLATTLDEFDWTWPSIDSGSSGTGGAKALRSLGLIAGWVNGFTVQAVFTALQTGPVLVGLPWRRSMFTPAPTGQVIVDPDSPVDGGHELCLDELDTEHDRVWAKQSWGEWGIDGRGWFSLADFALLLADDGDCVIPTPTPAAPEPAPAEPAGCLGQFTRVLRRGAR